MLVVDASCLFEVVASTRLAEAIRQRLSTDTDHAAPHVIDVEVLNVIRREHLRGKLDSTAAHQAVEDLRDWNGERFSHRPLIERAWDLRDCVRGWDAFYVALAETLGAALITIDVRLSRAKGLACAVELMS